MTKKTTRADVLERARASVAVTRGVQLNRAVRGHAYEAAMVISDIAGQYVLMALVAAEEGDHRLAAARLYDADEYLHLAVRDIAREVARG